MQMALSVPRSRPRTNPQGPTGNGGEEADLNWIDLDAADAAAHPSAMADIAARRLDGITVTGVLDPDECERAIAGLERHCDEQVEAIFGSMLGMSLANLAQRSGDPHDRSPYFDDAERVMEIYQEAFGHDPFDRVGEVMSKLAGGVAVGPPKESGRQYLAGNVRWMHAGGRGLPAHVGNEFQLANPAHEHLERVARVQDHYSWFVILQPPEEGGALAVFDLIYETHVPTDTSWRSVGRDDEDFDHLPARRIAPEAGALVLFGGGWRWHRVDRIPSGRPRVTYGGFAGPSSDGTAIHSWF
jgi:hypothetical protein